jgi:hypothetical protein
MPDFQALLLGRRTLPGVCPGQREWGPDAHSATLSHCIEVLSLTTALKGRAAETSFSAVFSDSAHLLVVPKVPGADSYAQLARLTEHYVVCYPASPWSSLQITGPWYTIKYGIVFVQIFISINTFTFIQRLNSLTQIISILLNNLSLSTHIVIMKAVTILSLFLAAVSAAELFPRADSCKCDISKCPSSGKAVC